MDVAALVATLVRARLGEAEAASTLQSWLRHRLEAPLTDGVNEPAFHVVASQRDEVARDVWRTLLAAQFGAIGLAVDDAYSHDGVADAVAITARLDASVPAEVRGAAWATLLERFLLVRARREPAAATRRAVHAVPADAGSLMTMLRPWVAPALAEEAPERAVRIAQWLDQLCRLATGETTVWVLVEAVDGEVERRRARDTLLRHHSNTRAWLRAVLRRAQTPSLDAPPLDAREAARLSALIDGVLTRRRSR
jgi:hypothetical protein